MSLDQNLFTLFFTPNTSFPDGTVVDLADGNDTIHYRKRRIIQPQRQLYRIEVTDPLSDALLASATAPSATSKHKTVELYNPSKVVELKHTGTLTFRWSFKWETHEFEWKREECFIVRKPDPPVLVAVTKEPPGRIRTASVQILDYNLNRFDIEDPKGLEIVILTALLTFQDSSDAYHDPSAATTATNSAGPVAATAAPTPPPKSTSKKGIEHITELQLGRDANEVTVFDEGAVKDYAKYCADLLRDDAMVFISVHSSDAKQVSRVLQVVEEAIRLRHKAGDPDLHQYVVHGAQGEDGPSKGPRIIKLDDKTRKDKIKEYTPPTSITVHLSKVDMPELRPRGARRDKQPATPHDQDGGKKNLSKHVKEKGKPKDKDKHVEQDARLKRPSLPSGPSASPRHSGSILRKYRSQTFRPTASSPSASGPSSFSAQHYSSGMHHRQSTYGPLSADYYYYDDRYDDEDLAARSNSPSTSGLLGRFLGR